MVGMTMLAVSRSLSTCTLFKAHPGERVLISIGNRLRETCYLSRDDHDHKIRARKQRGDIGKYSFVNRTIKL
jgi:hypothetical protein